MRTIIAWLVVSTLGLVSGLPHVTLADDAGPGKEVRAIHRALPSLLSARINHPHPSGVQIDAVVSTGLGAGLVQWHDGVWSELDRFEYRYQTWWLLDSYQLRTDGSVCCGNDARRAYMLGPSSYFLTQVGVPQSLIESAAQHLSVVQAADERMRERGGPERFWGAGGDPISPAIDLSRQNARGNFDSSPYEATIAFGRTDAASGTITLRGRAPTEAESWVTYGGNSYFFLSGKAQSPVPIHVAAGTTIDVWFPFVLDSSLYYGLTIAHTDKPIGPIDGTLKDNVVHFVLPAFTLLPDAILMGEIEGDPFRHE